MSGSDNLAAPATMAPDPMLSFYSRSPNFISDYYGPKGFCWLVEGVLGGARQPGIFDPLEKDLAALQRVGAQVLVTLTAERAPPEASALADFGIEGVYLAIDDMGVPDDEDARRLCATVQEHLEGARAVVYHCKAGKGRTGTLLAAQLIWAGMEPQQAIASVRSKNPNWIESDAQLQWLAGFRPR